MVLLSGDLDTQVGSNRNLWYPSKGKFAIGKGYDNILPIFQEL